MHDTSQKVPLNLIGEGDDAFENYMTQNWPLGSSGPREAVAYINANEGRQECRVRETRETIEQFQARLARHSISPDRLAEISLAAGKNGRKQLDPEPTDYYDVPLERLEMMAAFEQM